MSLKSNPQSPQELAASIRHDADWMRRFCAKKAKVSGTERRLLNRLEPMIEKMDKLEGML